MKNKFSLILVLFALFIPKFSAAEITTPNWIDIEYADLEHNYVSEYQLVNVSVTQKGMWWRDYNSEVNIDYDQNALNLVNVIYYDQYLNSTTSEESTVKTTDSSFKVTYQFYLKDNFDLSTTQIDISKTVNSKTTKGSVSIDTHSDRLMSNVKFGDIVIGYSVDQYVNDGETITYNAHFKVVSNPSNKPFTLSVKENNMTVDNTDYYEVKLRYTTGSVEAIDKHNFKISIPEGGTFDLNIPAQIEGLSSKNDRFEFLIFLSDSENFARIEPTYFRSEVISSDTNKRGDRFVIIKLLIALFFVFLAIIHSISSKLKSQKKQNKKSSNIIKKAPKS